VEVRDYLERIHINIKATVDPLCSIETLTYLQEQHLFSVPFENLDVHRGVAIVLDPPAILDKIVRRRRGGFCYELNSAFAWLLSELGFDVTFLSAEVARPGGEFDLPFGHLTLRVDIGGRSWLADVGFGESFIQPLPLLPDRPSDEGYRLRLPRHEDVWYLEKDGEAIYRFTLEPCQLADFEAACHHHQTSSESPFTQKVVTTRATPNGRVTLTPELCIVRENGKRSETTVNSEAEWRSALESHFGIVQEPPS